MTELSVVDERLAGAVVECDTFREDVVLAMSLDKHVRSDTSAFQDIADISLQLEDRSVLVGMCPRALNKFTCQPKGEMIVLGISLDRSLGGILLSCIAVDIANLEEAKILGLAVDIAGQRLQAAKEQRLTHHAQI